MITNDPQDIAELIGLRVAASQQLSFVLWEGAAINASVINSVYLLRSLAKPDVSVNAPAAFYYLPQEKFRVTLYHPEKLWAWTDHGSATLVLEREGGVAPFVTA